MNETGLPDNAAHRAVTVVLARIRSAATLLLGLAPFHGFGAVTSAHASGPIWSYTVKRSDAVPERLVVVEVEKGGKFAPTEVIVPQPPGNEQRISPFPLDVNLLEMLDLHPFGAEERVSAIRDGNAAVVKCEAGERPAGVLLRAPGFRYPRAMRGDLVLEGRGSAGFGFALTEAGQDAPSMPRTRSDGALLAEIPSSSWPKGSSARQLVVSCPKNAAEAAIEAIRIVPHGRDGSASVGTWLWDARPWLDHPERLRASATSAHVGDIFLQLPIEGGSVADAGKLRRLIEVLSDAGIAVHAIEGDPDMASVEGRSHALERARTLRRFQQASGLRSFQYDIEPYLRVSYGADPAAAWREWAITIKDLAALLGGKISAVVPFWMLDDPAAEQALLAAESSISGITVMAYRTDVSLVGQIAQEWLDWGAEHGIPIGVALENGQLPAERHKTYVRAPRGDLVLDLSRSPAVAQLMTTTVTGILTRPTYSFSHQVEVNPSRISFLGNREARTAATATLERRLSAWTSFGGMLVHELISPGGEGVTKPNRSRDSGRTENKNPHL